MKYIFSTIALFVCFSLSAQRNKTDEQARKQGFWEVFYDGTQIPKYRGEFLNDRPVGELRRYNTYGNIKTISVCERNQYICRSKFYDDNQNLIASGKYTNTKKDSLWVYYDRHGNIQMTEEYLNGGLNGIQTKYYTDGAIVEKKTFRDDIEHGEWKKFYQDGTLEAEGIFVDGNLDGEVVYYHPNGKIRAKGKYRNAVKDGNWRHYHSNGNIHYQELFKDGIRTKYRPENGEFKEYFDSNLPKTIASYENGKRQGVYKEFYPIADKVVEEINDYEDKFHGEKREVVKNQRVKFIANYKDDLLHGEATYYSENGKVERIEIYEKGELIKTKKK
jgi:antitoxin component YwqK of YwqJK toxin-antitoxin module